MTLPEAHEYLEDFQRIMTQHREAYSEDLIEANGQAILALEKQIPKKVEGNDYVVRYCPNCNVCIGDEYNNFCEKCGQALDWGNAK